VASGFNAMEQELRQIRGALGEPAYECDAALLYCGDCVGLLGKVRSKCFQLTVTSPPYNIGKEYEAELSWQAYLDWCERWIREVHRITAEDGAFWLNLGYISLAGRAKAIPLPYLLWDRVPFYLVQEVVWNYGAGVACRRSFSPRNEKFLWYVKDGRNYTFNLDDVRDPNVKYPNQKKNGKLRCNPRGKNPSDVWQLPKVTSGKDRSSKERTPHPAQFPVVVVERILNACSEAGDLILDPFMGSGTVAEAAIKTGRCVVGFEINPRYVEVAAKRLDGVSRRRNLNESQSLLFAVG
jgi:adenine-specific DNA-methyltransferase